VLTGVSWGQAQHIIKGREILSQLSLGPGAAMLGSQLALVFFGSIVVDVLLHHFLCFLFDSFKLLVLRSVMWRVERAVADTAVLGG